MGVPIDAQELDFICRIFTGYVQSTSNGKKYLLKELLNAGIEKNNYLKQYFYRNGMGERGVEIPYDSLVKFEGYIYENPEEKKTVFVNPNHILELDEASTLECDVTHTKMPKGYCIKQVRGSDNRTYNLSNYARMHSEVPSIRATSEQKTCANCRYLRCPYNPDGIKQIANRATTPPPLIENKPVFTNIKGLQ